MNGAFRPWAVVALFVVLALGWFAALGLHPLLNPDEGRYAEIPREMVASGDWVTPRLNGIKYFEKPPLQYWMTATAYEIFGASEWSARLWTALAGFLGVLLTAWLARRVFGPLSALLAAAVQAGSVLYAVLAHLTTLDMGLTFALQLALSGLVWLVHERDGPARGGLGVVLLAIGVALAFLSKGLVGILIPAAVAAIYMLSSGDWKLLWRSRPWWSVIALLLLAGPWVLAVSQRNPEFARFFFIHEHFERFLTRAHHRYESDTFFVPILLIGFLPWTPLLPALAADAWRSWRAKNRVVQLLAIWVLFVFLFFSFSQSKLIPYILPIFPALALLAGRLLAGLPQRRVARSLAISAGFWLMLAVVATFSRIWPGAQTWIEKSVGEAAPGLIAAIWLAGLATASSALLAVRDHRLAAAAVAVLGTMAFTLMALPSAPKLPKQQNITSILTQVQPHLTDQTRLYCVNDYIQSLPFYLNKTCTLVGYRGEMDFGMKQEPWRFIDNLPGFAAQWRAQSDAIAFVHPSAYEQLCRIDLPMRVLHSESTLIAIARR